MFRYSLIVSSLVLFLLFINETNSSLWNDDVTNQDFQTILSRHKRTFGSDGAEDTSVEGDVPNLTLQTAREHGYVVEEHHVTTPDGYILRLDRIKGTRKRGRMNDGRVVLIMHGTLGSSFVFVANGPDYALGLRLADSGYDVWLGNFRGTPASRNHTKLDPDDTQFWKFSYDEMATEDLPTMVNYICKQTENEKIFYVGYSNGARTLMLSAGAKGSSIANKIRLFVIMANNGAWDFSDRDTTTMRILGKIYKLAETFQIAEIGGRNSLFNVVLNLACGSGSISRSLCLKIVGKMLDKPPVISSLQLQKSRDAAQYLTALFGGTSIRAISHQNQLIEGETRGFNHGFFGNLYHHQSFEPPLYDLGQVRCPTAIYWSRADTMTPESDIHRLESLLPQVVHSHMIDSNDFDHPDFVFSKKAPLLVYSDIINVMNKVNVESDSVVANL